MRDRIYLASFLFGAGLLLYFGRKFLPTSAIVTGGLAFAGTTAAAVLGLALYRVQLELRASQRELARKEAELNIAREVQQTLFPRQFPVDGGLEFAATCVPASGISGDYYDVMELSDGRLAFAIADISGKGISAAILMSNLQAVLRTLTEALHSPGEVCALLNRHLYKVTDATRFATFFYAEWDRSKRRLRYVNAGHNPPIVRGSTSGPLPEPLSTPLGLFYESEFHADEIQLQPGDLMVLYSDGITEAGARQGEEFGEVRLEAVIAAHAEKSLAEIQQEIPAAVHNWSGREPEDDMTLLLVRALESAQERP